VIDAQDLRGETALHLAAKQGKLPLVTYLLEKGTETELALTRIFSSEIAVC
jgi:ankyrin repeat protein